MSLVVPSWFLFKCKRARKEAVVAALQPPHRHPTARPVAAAATVTGYDMPDEPSKTYPPPLRAPVATAPRGV